MQPNLNVQWQDFSIHLKGTLHEMLKTEEFTDVTLVCDDQKEFKAHKVILSACSSVFRKMLQGRSNPNSIIFLKGVTHMNLDLILQFIYNGETALPQTNLETFLDVARSLHIKELSDVGMNSQTIELDGVPVTKEYTGKDNNPVDVKEGLVKEEEEPNNQLDKTVEETLDVTPSPLAKYFCDVCNYPFFKKAILAKHAKDVHGKPSIYACKRDDCSYVSTERSTLKHHLESHLSSKPSMTEKEESKMAESKVVKFEQKMIKSEQKKMFACFLCMYKTEDKNDLAKHTLAEHQKDFPCPLPASLPSNSNSSNANPSTDNSPSAETPKSSN